MRSLEIYIPEEFSDYASTDKAKANNLTRFLNDMKAWGFLGNNGRDKWCFIKSAMRELEHMRVDAK